MVELGGKEAGQRSWASSHSWGWFVYWLGHFGRVPVAAGSKDSVSHKEKAHMSPKQPKPPIYLTENIKKNNKIKQSLIKFL